MVLSSNVSGSIKRERFLLHYPFSQHSLVLPMLARSPTLTVVRFSSEFSAECL